MIRRPVLAFAMTAPFLLTPSAQAAAVETACGPLHDDGHRNCFEMTLVKRTRVIVETVPLVNRSSQTAEMHCSFSRSITKSEDFSATVGVEIEKEIPFVANLKFSGSFSRTKSQSATQASEAGGSVTLAPGESVDCNRTYGSVVFDVHKWTNYGPDHNHSNKYFRVRVPSYLGVMMTD